MDELAAILAWSGRALATTYAAAMIGGVLILVADLARRRREPPEADVQRAARWYRRSYGADALMVVGDHILGASFAPDRRHIAFLRRVSARLLRDVITPEDRARAIDRHGHARSYRPQAASPNRIRASASHGPPR